MFAVKYKHELFAVCQVIVCIMYNMYNCLYVDVFMC